ncbi:MAG: HDIG domain-containing protein [Paludibacter sp.]|nr:HDIG domain-containing protein [Paludibacter sp.]
MNPILIIEKYYKKTTDLYRLIVGHSNLVAQKAMDICNTHTELNADLLFVQQAAMLHDIGILLCNAPSIFCYGKHNYIEHGYLGGQILRKEGLIRHALVAERHTGTGIPLEEIIKKDLPLPHRNFCPLSIEEKIICYADKFFSKSNPEKEFSIDEIRNNLSKFSQKNVDIFNLWNEMFT